MNCPLLNYASNKRIGLSGDNRHDTRAVTGEHEHTNTRRASAPEGGADEAQEARHSEARTQRARTQQARSNDKARNKPGALRNATLSGVLCVALVALVAAAAT